MSDTDETGPTVPIVCVECDTAARVPLAEVAAMVERHNQQLHDGADVAEVDPEIADRLADLVAEELGLV